MRQILFAIIFSVSPLLAQQQPIWSTHARGATLPTTIPRAGYMFYRTADSTNWYSTGITWQQMASGTGGISVATARRFTGWTAEGIDNGIAQDTLASKFILGRKEIQLIIVDADNDSVKIKPQDLYPFKIVDGATFIAGIDSTGKIGILVEPTRASFEQKVILSTDAIFGSNTPGIGIFHNPPTIGFNTYLEQASGLFKSISTGYGARIFADPTTGGLNFYTTSASAATDVTQTYPSIPALQITKDGYIGISYGTGHTEKGFIETYGKLGKTTAIFGRGDNGIGLTTADPNILFNGYYSTDYKADAAGFVGRIGLDNAGVLLLSSTSSSVSANATASLVNRLFIEPDGDGIISGGTKAPMTGTISISGKDLIVSREGTIANSDSSAALRVVTGLGDLLLKNGSGNGVEVKIDASDNMDLITLSTASVTITNGSFEGNSLVRSSDNFSGTAATDTVNVTGGTTNDYYQITFTSALESTITSFWVEALTGKFVVHLEGLIVSGNDTYNWFRIK